MNASASAVGPTNGRMRISLGGIASAVRPQEVLPALLIGGATAAAVTYTPVPHVILAGIAAVVVLALVIVASPALAAVLLGLSIPAIPDLTGGRLGVHVAASDVLLVLIGVRLLTDAEVRHRMPALPALRRVRVPVLQYVWLMAILLVLHLTFGSALKSAQRLELFVLPMVVGAYIALRRQHMLVLRGYVVATTVLAAAWPVMNSTGFLSGQFQKNPVGGFIVSAILLLLATRGNRRMLWCMPVLIVGLALSASRGAVAALIVGVIVLAFMQSSASRGRLVARVAVLVAVVLMALPFLPSSITSRLTNYAPTTSIASVTASGGSQSSWATYYHAQYANDAARLIAAHPLIGVGVGNYLAGSYAADTVTTDPHNVLLLEAAEGGYLFAVSFALLILGVALVLWRMRRSELAPAAAAVLVATAAHGLVDVYWVRGTPVLGWLLVGMVCGIAFQRKQEARA